MTSAERLARMGLCGLGAMGSPVVSKAVADLGAETVWQGLLAEGDRTAMGRRAAAQDLGGLQRATSASGCRFIIPGDDEWPPQLDALSGASVGGQGGLPIGLWVLGESLHALTHGVAVVGARACTAYGERVALAMAADLAAERRSVISGLAYGIDAAAHRGALGARGTTLAVLAGGLDEPYPAANARLAESVRRHGALVSETPPGYRPARFAFLARNRLIAALAEGVVVVEASSRSGAKNTASWGLALGRPVMAVPGPVTSSLSATPHRLIRDGEAVLVCSAEDVVALLAPPGDRLEPSGRGKDRPIDLLPPGARAVREAVRSREEVSVADLSARTGQTLVEVMANVSELIDRGWLEEGAEGLVRLPRR